jgi:protein SCO1/2
MRKVLWIALFFACAAPARAASGPLPFFDAAELTPYWPSAGAGRFTPAKVTPFHALDQSGRAVTERSLSGRISLVNFFFAACPGVCPTMMRSLRGFEEKLGPAGEGLRTFSFSVQPEADSPKRLRGYARDHGIDLKRWSLVTGDRAEIYRLGKEVFKADASVGAQKSETSFLHSTNVYLVDKELRIRGIYDTSDRAALGHLGEDLARLQRE